VGADSLDNFQIGGPKRGVFAYRFRAPWTGTVASVKFFAILNTEERPAGYSGGTGGTFRVSLVADVDGTPGRDVLAQAAYAPTRANLFPRLRFPAPAPVERGRYYAIVFTNIDENPVENFASINTLYVDPATDARPRSIPADVSMLWADGATDLETPIAWTRDPVGGDGHFPVVDIAGGEPGQHLGYGYMEIWSENAKPIGGPASVRQRFTFEQVSPARVRKVWIRLRRTSDSAAPLRISLETPDGRLLATALSAANRIREDRPGWVTVTFPGAPILRPRQTVALVLRAGSERAYEAYPVRDGSLFGFTAATVFPEGYAQFTSAGGWKGWDQWGKYDRHDGDLQFGLGLTRVVP
jgi:hypothetical protein